MENQPNLLKTYKNWHGTMKNQSGTIKTNLELYRVVMGGSGGYRRLAGGSDDFSWHTDRQTLHHNIYIVIIITSKKQTSAEHNGRIIRTLSVRSGSDVGQVSPAGETK